MIRALVGSLDSARVGEWIKRMIAQTRAFALKNTAVANAAGVTLTVAQLFGGYITRSGAAAVSDTFPTAAAIVAAIDQCEVGDSFEFGIINTNSGTLTLVAGAGITLAGTTTAATNTVRRYLATVTNVSTPAVTIRGLDTAAV